MRLITITAAFTSLLALSACSSEIFHTFHLAEGETSLTTDSKQRLISNVGIGTASQPGIVEPVRIICVEPSPDVAVAVANSLGGAVGIAGKGSFAISGAQAEGIAQLAERTTAIQAILKQGYQGCIDYMNGAISATTYSLRQARLDDLLVTLVLAEDAAGAFGRSGAALGTSAEAQASAKASLLSSLGKSLEDANSDLEEKQAAVDKAKEEKETAQAAVNTAEAGTDEAEKTQTKGVLTEKQKALDEAVRARDEAVTRATGLTEATTKAAASVEIAVGQGGITAKPDPEIARVIGEMQDTFVNKDMEQAYISTCLTELGLRKTPSIQNPGVIESAANRFKASLGKNEEDSIGGEDYYQAAHNASTTALTADCQQNLATVVFIAQNNSDQRKRLAMELETQRLIAGKQSPDSATLGSGVHPISAFNAAVAARDALRTARAQLDKKPVPPAKGTFTAELRTALDKARTKALTDSQAILDRSVVGAADSLESDRQATIQTIENKHLNLVFDLRRNGTDAEKQTWEGEVLTQQENAKKENTRLKAYLGDVDAAREAVEAVLTRINQIPAS